MPSMNISVLAAESDLKFNRKCPILPLKPGSMSCPCGKALPVTKVISAPAIMFKGTGWYVTDYSDKMKDRGSKSEEQRETR